MIFLTCDNLTSSFGISRSDFLLMLILDWLPMGLLSRVSSGSSSPFGDLGDVRAPMWNVRSDCPLVAWELTEWWPFKPSLLSMSAVTAILPFSSRVIGLRRRLEWCLRTRVIMLSSSSLLSSRTKSESCVALTLSWSDFRRVLPLCDRGNTRLT